jgi:hypothetical protein
LTDRVRDTLVAIKKILDAAEADKFSGEIEIRLVYGQGGIRDCFHNVKQKLNV